MVSGIMTADAGLRVDQASAHASIGTVRPASAYATISNGTDHPARPAVVSSPVSGHAVVHKTVKENGIMTMAPGPAAIPAGGRFRMKHGEFHIMLRHLERPLQKTTRQKLAPEIAGWTKVDAVAPVLGPEAFGPCE